MTRVELRRGSRNAGHVGGSDEDPFSYRCRSTRHISSRARLSGQPDPMATSKSRRATGHAGVISLLRLPLSGEPPRSARSRSTSLDPDRPT